MNEESPPLILIHSPLVGGSFWGPVAREAERRGVRCYVPALERNSDESVPPWRRCPDLLAEGIPSSSRAIVVGHSAAGMLLPAVAERVGAVGLIFVDATLAPATGTAPPVEREFMKFVEGLPVVEGHLPRWSEWWPRAAMESLMPEEETRRLFEADLPRLSVDWFEDSIEVPAWNDLPVGYVQTSSRFEREAETARSRGWPVIVVEGSHLHPFLEPVESTDAILAVVRELR